MDAPKFIRNEINTSTHTSTKISVPDLDFKQDNPFDSKVRLMDTKFATDKNEVKDRQSSTSEI